jgi:hypothetical protein
LHPNRPLRTDRAGDAGYTLQVIGNSVAVEVYGLVEGIDRVAADSDFEPVREPVLVQVRLKVDSGTDRADSPLRTDIPLHALRPHRAGGARDALKPLQPLEPLCALGTDRPLRPDIAARTGGTDGSLNALGPDVTARTLSTPQVDGVAPRSVRIAELQRGPDPVVRRRRTLRSRDTGGAGVPLLTLRPCGTGVSLRAGRTSDALRPGRTDCSGFALLPGRTCGSRRSRGAGNPCGSGATARLKKVRDAVGIGVERHVHRVRGVGTDGGLQPVEVPVHVGIEGQVETLSGVALVASGAGRSLRASRTLRSGRTLQTLCPWRTGHALIPRGARVTLTTGNAGQTFGTGSPRVALRADRTGRPLKPGRVADPTSLTVDDRSLPDGYGRRVDVAPGDVQGLRGDRRPLRPKRAADPHPGLKFGVIIDLNPEPQAHARVEVRGQGADLTEDDAEGAVAHIEVRVNLVPQGLTALTLGVEPKRNGARSVDRLTANIRQRTLVGHRQRCGTGHLGGGGSGEPKGQRQGRSEQVPDVQRHLLQGPMRPTS